MTANDKTRKFPRLEVPEEARVYDENGRELGTIAEVSGSGMSLKTASSSISQSLEVGRHLRISVVEPGSRETNILVVAVRHLDASKLGLEFVESLPDKR